MVDRVRCAVERAVQRQGLLHLPAIHVLRQSDAGRRVACPKASAAGYAGGSTARRSIGAAADRLGAGPVVAGGLPHGRPLPLMGGGGPGSGVRLIGTTCLERKLFGVGVADPGNRTTLHLSRVLPRGGRLVTLPLSLIDPNRILFHHRIIGYTGNISAFYVYDEDIPLQGMGFC